MAMSKTSWSIGSQHRTADPNVQTKNENGEVSVREVNQWTADAVVEWGGCVEGTDWEVFFIPGDNLDQRVTVISDYIALCDDMIIPKESIKSFPNSKS